MSNKSLSPQQSAIRKRALTGYVEAFEARGFPVPESEGFASARCEVRLDGMARTVWANGRAGPWLDLRGLMKEFYGSTAKRLARPSTIPFGQSSTRPGVDR